MPKPEPGLGGYMPPRCRMESPVFSLLRLQCSQRCPQHQRKMQCDLLMLESNGDRVRCRDRSRDTAIAIDVGEDCGLSRQSHRKALVRCHFAARARQPPLKKETGVDTGTGTDAQQVSTLWQCTLTQRPRFFCQTRVSSTCTAHKQGFGFDGDEWSFRQRLVQDTCLDAVLLEQNI